MAAAERQPENTAPRMLLLRPRQRLTADVESCRAAGWQGVPFAPLEAQPLPDALAALPQQLAQSAAAFWVSPTAVEIAAPAAFSGSLKALPHVAVGAATAAALHAAGAQNVVFDPAGKDSESAARLPIWRTLPAGAQVLVVRGESGRGHLAAELAAVGLRPHFAPVYRLAPLALDWQLFCNPPPQAVWLTALQCADAMLAQLPAELAQSAQSLLYFTHHERIRRGLLERGMARVFCVADLPAAFAAYGSLNARLGAA